MISDIFLTNLEISAAMGLVIIALVLCAPILDRRYAAKWKYWLWIILALRLLIPFNDFWLPNAVTDAAPAYTFGDSAEKNGISASSEDDGNIEIIPSGRIIVEIPKQMSAPILASRAEEKGEDGISWIDLVVIVWLTGGAMVLAVYLLSYFRYRKELLENGHPLRDDLILCILNSLKEEMHIGRSMTVVEYREAASPMVLGFLHPVLVLPEEPYDSEELFFILKHELIHLKRNDIWVKLLFAVASAVHWFNPMVWIMQKEAVIDMELSCDECVVQGKDFSVRKAYTETLLSSLHRNCTRRTILSTQFYGGKKIMKKRFVNILKGAHKKKGLLSMAGMAFLTVGLGTFVSCSMTGSASGIDFGIDLKADLDGDGTADQLNVFDTRSGSAAFTQLIATLQDGTWRSVNYEGRYSSYAVTGDLSGNGSADVLLVRYDTEEDRSIDEGQSEQNLPGTMAAAVLRFEDGEWKEYPSCLIANPDIELYQPESFGGEDGEPEEGQENIYVGATIVEKQNRNYLRLILAVDPTNHETVECIDAFWQEDGWHIEQVQLIENYYLEGYSHKLLENTYEQLKAASALASPIISARYCHAFSA